MLEGKNVEVSCESNQPEIRFLCNFDFAFIFV